MQTAPHEFSQTAKPTRSSTDLNSIQHDGSSTDLDPATGDRHLYRSSSEPSVPETGEDDVSVSSSRTDRERSIGYGRLSQDSPPSETSPGSRITAYEQAHTPERRRSDSVIFQIVPSTGSKDGAVSVMDFPNEVLVHILSHLPPETLSMMSLVNTRFHNLVTTPPAWRIAFSRIFLGAESTGLKKSTEDVDKANAARFTRVSALASWRSEYILRTRLLRALSRGRPAIESLPASSSRHKNMTAAMVMYGSKLMYPVSHIHANFGTGLNKKQPLFIHGAVEQGAVSASDPASGAVGGWGLADFEAFRHFADVFPGETEYGLGTGEIVGMPNVMDISQSFGKLYGEACPGGRLFYTGTNEQRGRHLVISTPAQYAAGIPETNLAPSLSSFTSVWLAKSENVLKVSSGVLGLLAGTSNGILMAYSIGSSPVYDTRFEKGEVTAVWAICPGVPIVAIDVDEKVSGRRLGRGRIFAAVLNALGEVYHLQNIPVLATRHRIRAPVWDQMSNAWTTGRSAEWQLIEASRRTARPDPFQLGAVDGSYSPQSSSYKAGLDPAQLEAEAREIEQFLKYKPKHFQTVCEGWDMRRKLLVDYAGENKIGGGEAFVVVNTGLDEDTSASIKRYTRHRIRISDAQNEEQYPSLTKPDLSAENSLQRGGDSTPTYSNPRSRTSSTDSLFDPSFKSAWHQSSFTFGLLKNIQITSCTIDCSDLAVLTANEDPLLNISAGSDSSSPFMSPVGQRSIVSSAAEIPGRRARLFGVGTGMGTVLLWDIRASDPPAPDMMNHIQPVRIIYTKSPKISSLAITSLYVVHGGNDGLVQAWDPLASTTDPIRTLNSRFSDRARRRIAQAEASVHGVGNNYYAAGAIVLDNDPTVLRGMVSLGTHLRYWSYHAGGADAYKTRKRGQLRKKSPRTSNAAGSYHHTGRGVLRGMISDERLELEQEKMNKLKQAEHLNSRFGTDLLGDGASEEEMLAYATMLSEEAFVSGDLKGRDSSPSKADLPSSSMDADLEEAIRLSLLEADVDADAMGTMAFELPVGMTKKARRKAQRQAYEATGSSVADDNADLEFALQLSLAEQESKKISAVLQEDFPVLQKSSSESSVEGKGKGRRVR